MHIFLIFKKIIKFLVDESTLKQKIQPPQKRSGLKRINTILIDLSPEAYTQYNRAMTKLTFNKPCMYIGKQISNNNWS